MLGSCIRNCICTTDASHCSPFLPLSCGIGTAGRCQALVYNPTGWKLHQYCSWGVKKLRQHRHNLKIPGHCTALSWLESALTSQLRMVGWGEVVVTWAQPSAPCCWHGCKQKTPNSCQTIAGRVGRRHSSSQGTAESFLALAQILWAACWQTLLWVQSSTKVGGSEVIAPGAETKGHQQALPS